MTRRLAKISIFLTALGLTALTAACSAIDTIDPPRLYLDVPYMQSRLPRGDYVITNGKGEVLMEAKDLHPEQEHEARFDLDKLDGTLNIVATKDGKTIYTQTLRHTPGKRVKLEWNIEDDRFDLTEIAAPRSPGPKADGGGRD